MPVRLLIESFLSPEVAKCSHIRQRKLRIGIGSRCALRSQREAPVLQADPQQSQL